MPDNLGDVLRFNLPQKWGLEIKKRKKENSGKIRIKK